MSGNNLTIGDLTQRSFATTLKIEVETATPESGYIFAGDLLRGGDWQFGSLTAVSVVGPIAYSLATGYDYCWSFQGVRPVTDGDALTCQMSQSGAYLTATTDYNDGSGNGLITLVSAMGNASGEGCTAEIVFQNPAASGFTHRIQSWSIRADTSGNEGLSMGGGRIAANTSACDAVRFSFPSGGFATVGSIAVFYRRIA